MDCFASLAMTGSASSLGHVFRIWASTNRRRAINAQAEIDHVMPAEEISLDEINISNPINQGVSPQFTAEAAGSQNRFSRVRARSAIRSSGKRPITK